MARPRLKIDPDQVEKLAAIGCTMGEMASIMSCSVDTLERRYAERIEKGRSNRKMRLRHKQTQVALEGNVVMLIWLGKQELGQSEKIEQKVDTAQLERMFDAIIRGPVIDGV